MSERMSHEDLTLYLKTTLLSGQGRIALKTIIHQTGIFTYNSKPEQVAARNAGMRILYDILGGITDEHGETLADCLIDGLSRKYSIDLNQQDKKEV